MKNTNTQSGLTPINIAIIVAAILIVLGGGIYWWFYGSSKTTKALDKLKVEDITMDFSLSPMPVLDLSSFNIPLPELSGIGLFSAIEVSSDFSYQGDVKLSAPSYELNVSLPAGAPASEVTSAPTNVPDAAPAATPTGAPASTGAPAEQSADCSQFTAVPSCSMVGGGTAYDLCKQCYPNK